MTKFSNLTLRKIFSDKRVSIPFSILLSFAIWIVITVSQKPNMERTIGEVSVSINLSNTFAAENSLSIIGDISEEKFTVSVRGPSSVVSTLTAGDLNLYASAAEVDAPGDYTLKVLSNVADTNAGYEVLSITPATINVTFDYIETKEFTVVAVAEGASAEEGLIAEAGVVGGTEKDTIQIVGPRTVVNKIERVVAFAKVNKVLSSSQTFDADIMLLDEKGEEISADNLKLSDTKVNVTVPISKKKMVPVVADFGNLPSGFDKSSIAYTVNHPTVTVIGTPETIDKINQVTLSPIDISTVSLTSASFDVSPKLSDGIRLLDSIDVFTVSIDLTNFQEKIITVSTVKYKEVASGLSAAKGGAIANVKICGPKSVIAKFNETKAYADVYLTDKNEGEHTVNAIISFDGYNNIWSVGTYTTTVTIK